MSNVRQERFFIPLGLTKVDEISGLPVYSSDAIKNKFLDAVKETPKLNPIYSKISKMIKESSMIAGFARSNLIFYLISKPYSNKLGLFLGCYSKEKNKIYILVDSLSSKIFWVVDDSLADVVLHELCHWAMTNRSREFFSVFKKQLIEFYQLFFSLYVDLAIPPNDIWKLVSFMHTTFERGKPKQSDLDRLENFYLNNITDDQKALASILYPINLYLLDPQKFIHQIYRDERIHRLIITLLHCYSSVFKIRRARTIPIQELLFPGEVIAISSQNPDNRHYTVF